MLSTGITIAMTICIPTVMVHGAITTATTTVIAIAITCVIAVAIAVAIAVVATVITICGYPL